VTQVMTNKTHLPITMLSVNHEVSQAEFRAARTGLLSSVESSKGLCGRVKPRDFVSQQLLPRGAESESCVSQTTISKQPLAAPSAPGD
jgi:hypothetical protein